MDIFKGDSEMNAWHLLLRSIKDFFWSSLSGESIVLLGFGVLKTESDGDRDDPDQPGIREAPLRNGGRHAWGRSWKRICLCPKIQKYISLNLHWTLQWNIDMEYKEIENSPSSVAAHHGQKCGHTLMLTFSFLWSQICTLQIVLPQLFSLLGSVMRLFENNSWFSLLVRLTTALPNLLQFDQVVNNSLPPPSHPFTTSQVAQPLLLVVYNTPTF